MNNVSDPHFWEQRYAEGQTGWDMGIVSPPLQALFEDIDVRATRILIPGCGNSYEAIWLAEHGFTDVTVVDFARQPVERLQKVLQEKDLTGCKVIHDDFFAHKGTYDFIAEQTFFCAIDPKRRVEYVEKMHSLLATGGMLAGVLFRTPFEKEGPPFGGTAEEYETLFSKKFVIKTLQPCKISHPPRAGNELFFQCIRRS